MNMCGRRNCAPRPPILSTYHDPSPVILSGDPVSKWITWLHDPIRPPRGPADSPGNGREVRMSNSSQSSRTEAGVSDRDHTGSAGSTAQIRWAGLAGYLALLVSGAGLFLVLRPFGE